MRWNFSAPASLLSFLPDQTGEERGGGTTPTKFRCKNGAPKQTQAGEKEASLAMRHTVRTSSAFVHCEKFESNLLFCGRQGHTHTRGREGEHEQKKRQEIDTRQRQKKERSTQGGRGNNEGRAEINYAGRKKRLNEIITTVFFPFLFSTVSVACLPR